MQPETLHAALNTSSRDHPTSSTNSRLNGFIKSGWSASGRRGQLSSYAVDDRHESGKDQSILLMAINADGTPIEASFCQAIRLAEEQKSVSLEKHQTTGSFSSTGGVAGFGIGTTRSALIPLDFKLPELPF